MIRIEDTQEFPGLTWMPQSEKEFDLSTPEAKHTLMTRSSPVKLFLRDEKPILLAGIYRPSLIGDAWLWTLLTPEFEALRVSELRLVIAALDHFAPRCVTAVELGNDRAERLARLFKFQAEESQMATQTSTYVLYRRG